MICQKDSAALKCHNRDIVIANFPFNEIVISSVEQDLLGMSKRHGDALEPHSTHAV